MADRTADSDLGAGRPAGWRALLCLPIRNTPTGRTRPTSPRPFALLTDTQRPLRIG